MFRNEYGGVSRAAWLKHTEWGVLSIKPTFIVIWHVINLTVNESFLMLMAGFIGVRAGGPGRGGPTEGC